MRGKSRSKQTRVYDGGRGTRFVLRSKNRAHQKTHLVFLCYVQANDVGQSHVFALRCLRSDGPLLGDHLLHSKRNRASLQY